MKAGLKADPRPRLAAVAPTSRRPLRGLIFTLVFVLATLPIVVIALALSFLWRSNLADRDRAHLNQAIVEVGRSIDVQLNLHRAAVQLAAGLVEKGSAPAEAALAETRLTHPEFITMLRADKAGIVTDASPADLRVKGMSIADRPYFAAVRDTTKPFVSGVFQGRGFGSDVLVAISVPVSNPKGGFDGIIEGSLEIHRFGDSLSTAGLPEDVAVAVVDDTGRVILADSGTGLSPLDQLPRAMLEAIPGAQDATLGVVNLPGVNGPYARVRAMRGYCESGISVIAMLPAGVRLSQFLSLYLWLAVALAALLGLAAWVATAASRRLAWPLETFARDAVDQAESGELGEMSLPGSDVPREVTMVFAAFNCLIGRVRESHAALARTNSELDARVAERTRELKAAQERAEAANRSKTDFVAMTGHEIRTPLNAIIGLAEVAAEEVPPGPVTERLRTIHRAGTRLLTVINDLLDLSRVEAGKLPLRLAPVELGALASEIKTLFAMKARQQGLALEVAIETRLPLWIETDGARLLQVLINLVGNALKFTREGGIRVVIRVLDQTADQVSLRFGVIDTGPGIPVEEQARLFQPYVQLANGESNEAVGSGLGLAISRKLVGLLGGALAVQNAPERGTEFHFNATFRLATPAPLPVVAPVAPPPDVDPMGMKILVVDDNLANQEVLRAFLEGKGVEIQTAERASEAIDWLKREAFEVALIDLEMPDGGGELVAQAMAASPGDFRSDGCILIAVSAHTAGEKRAECLGLGFDEYLAKPVKRQELLRMLHDLTATHRDPPPRATPAS